MEQDKCQKMKGAYINMKKSYAKPTHEWKDR